MRKARGYSGWYNNVYLRSFLEFAYAYYLDNKGFKWDYETEIFDLEGVSYKPDFYILDENNDVVKVVEIKGEGNRELGIEKVEKFRKMYSYDIEILFYKDLVQLYKNEMPLRLNTAKGIWINEYGAKLHQLVDGEYNPMFGKKHSEKTRELISKKAKERCESKEYRQMLAQKMIEHNRNNNFACARVERAKREVRVCNLDSCSNKFTVTEGSKQIYCCHEHSCKASAPIGAKALKEKSQKELEPVRDYILDWALRNKGLVLETKFNKIKGSFEELYNDLEKQFNVKDKRTISKAVFGEQKSRKELLKFLKEYVV